MPYQYKRESLNDDEVNRLTNTCDAFGEKFVIWTLLGTDHGEFFGRTLITAIHLAEWPLWPYFQPDNQQFAKAKKGAIGEPTDGPAGRRV